MANIRKWPAFLLYGINVSLVILLSEILTFLNIYSNLSEEASLTVRQQLKLHATLQQQLIRHH